MREKYTTNVKPNLQKIKAMREAGIKIEDIARTLNVHPSTFWQYQKDNPELDKIIKKASIIKEEQIVELAKKSLLRKFDEGWEDDEIIIETKTEDDGRVTVTERKKRKYQKPSDTILIFTLKNKCPEIYNKLEKEIAEARIKKLNLESSKIEDGSDIASLIAEKLGSYQ